MKKSYLEFTVGLFILIGLGCLAYLSIAIARNETVTPNTYEVEAVFTNCNGLRKGASVTIAGVEIGRVKEITLQDYEAKVSLLINPGVMLQKDVIASIRSKGLIGEKFVELTPGAADQKIAPGGTIRETEPALDMESLISKFVNGSVAKPSN